MQYIFDGTYYGLLTCVFDAFSKKEFDVKISSGQQFNSDMFAKPCYVQTDIQKGKRIVKALNRLLGAKNADIFFRAYLSEDPIAFQTIFNILMKGFSASFDILKDFGDKDILHFSQILKQVGREQHRMKAFVRFQKSNDGLYFALIGPDFNVLPLIAYFFKNRYSDQRWMIYDTKRNYGLMYDLKSVFEVQLQQFDQNAVATSQSSIELDEEELKYQRLWKQYFKSTNIEARKNMKLHIQHVPKRYWKYLIEKQGD